MGQAVVILVSIVVLWLAVATATIGACRVAAQGDGVEEMDSMGSGDTATLRWERRYICS
jgi:hypothetical protein